MMLTCKEHTWNEEHYHGGVRCVYCGMRKGDHELIQRMEAENQRLLEAIRKHRAQFTKETPVRAVDLELWQRLEE